MVQFKDDLVQLYTLAFHCSDQHRPEIPRLMLKPWQHEKQHAVDAPQLGNVTVCLLCAVGWQGLGWLRQQQPCPHAWPHTSLCGIFFVLGQTLRQSWRFSHWESLHRGRLAIRQRQFWEFCTGYNCILSPALIMPSIFKILSKPKWKPTSKVLICQKGIV